MQIHEMTQPGDPQQLDEIFDTTRAFLKNPKNLFSRQGRINARAADAANKLAKQGYTGTTVPTLQDAEKKFKENPAAQQWVNQIVAQWPAQADKIKKDLQKSATSVSEALPGSQRRQATLARRQMASRPPAPPTSLTPSKTYADLFRNWVDQQLKTITLKDIEQDLAVADKNRLDDLMVKIEQNQNDLSKQQPLVKDFLSLAVAANHVARARYRTGQYMRSGNSLSPANSVISQDQEIQVDPQQLFLLKSKIKNLGIRQARTTRVPALDKLLAQLGIQVLP